MSTKKETSNEMASLAARVLRTGDATKAELKALAGSVLGQDETLGRRPNKGKPKGKPKR